MSKTYILALDQGTSSSRAILFDQDAQLIDSAQQEFSQHFPRSGWVEHDPMEIWQSQEAVLQQVMQSANVKAEQIAAIGITNQRETTVVWNRITGQPVYNAIVWQDKRTADLCQILKNDDWERIIQRKTGLVLDAYFSATKIQWILQNVPQARTLADAGDLLFGTIDTWLLWQLTQGKKHVTDSSNAARTLLFNIETQEWDSELLDAFNVPASMLPKVQDSASHFGDYPLNGVKIPVTGMIGDQQSALFGQLCLNPGDVKNTYGTGCFMLLNTGEYRAHSEQGLLSTVAWRLQGKTTYALEGSVYVAGAAVQWLRDGLQMVEQAQETEQLANEAKNDDVVVVPAFVGLGAPHWDMYARGAMFGLTRDSGKAEIARATLQALAFQSYEVLDAMQKDSETNLNTLKVDGGAIANNYLAQFQADILQIAVERPTVIESTATGAAYMAGIGCHLWSIEFLQAQRKVDRIFESSMSDTERQKLLKRWNRAVERTKGWLLEDENDG